MNRSRLPSWARSLRSWCLVIAAVCGVLAIAYQAYSWNSDRLAADANLRATVDRHTNEIDKSDSRLTRVESTVNKIDGKVDVVIRLLTKPQVTDEAAMAKGRP